MLSTLHVTDLITTQVYATWLRDLMRIYGHIIVLLSPPRSSTFSLTFYLIFADKIRITSA